MRKKALGGGLALLLVGLSVATAAPRDDIYNDDPPKAASKQPTGAWSTFRNWFGTTDKKPATPDKTSVKKTDAAPTKTVVAPKKTDPSVVRQREQVDLDRRRSVVIRLLEIATETNDAELQRMADQLDERAWMLYMQRTAPPTREQNHFRERRESPGQVPEGGQFHRQAGEARGGR